MNAVPTIATIAARVMEEITEDILDETVPATVRTYSELHDYVDANMYADDLITRYQAETGLEWTDFINDVTDIVDVWLRAGRPTDLQAQQMGSSWHESMPIYLGEHGDTVPPAVVTERAERAASFAGLPTVYAASGVY